MIADSALTRPATPLDESQISDLLYFANNAHRHMDWRDPLDWLGHPHYWALEEHGRVVAAMACPQDPPGIAWIRLFAHAPRLSSTEAWLPLWNAALPEVRASGEATFAAIVSHEWFKDVLLYCGFSIRQHIVMLTWLGKPFAPRMEGIVIRPMTLVDFDPVVKTDWSAFDSLWRNSRESLRRAYAQASYATVAELDGKIAGYQVSAVGERGAHLARLAVQKEAQGRGIGSALMGDLTSHLFRRGTPRLSVNTQDDNIASLGLYEKVGFTRTGETYPILTYEAAA